MASDVVYWRVHVKADVRNKDAVAIRKLINTYSARKLIHEFGDSKVYDLVLPDGFAPLLDEALRPYREWVYVDFKNEPFEWVKE